MRRIAWCSTLHQPRCVALELPMKTADLTGPVRKAVYITGRLPLLDSLGSLARPDNIFLFSLSRSEEINCFTS
jgi:hypothetical protein